MQGIKYLVDDTGKKTAVQIDLKEWGKFGKTSMML